jgi:RNA polymerase sigma factor (sigma-70 family)
MPSLLDHQSALSPLGENTRPAPGAHGRVSREQNVNRVRQRRGSTVAASARGRTVGRLSDGDVARLVEAAAAGDQNGWDALVREFGGLIRAIARAHRLRDAHAAEVAQVTWLRLCEHLVHVRDPARVGAWLATTARRECLRVLRDGGRQVLLEDGALEPESHEMPGDELLVDERDRALWHAFGCLRPSDQALLHMLLVADPRPSYEQISAALDIPIGSIGPTRARALERLRQQLDHDGTLTLMTI